MTLRWLAVLTLVTLTFSSPAFAQEPAPIATGLNGPRGLSYADDGTLYIAEVGTGGDIEVQGAFGPAFAGSSGSISTVLPDGTQSVALTGLPSRNEAGEVTGSTRAVIHEGMLWIVINQGTLRIPFTYSVLALDPETMRIRQIIDTYTLELTQNPDGLDIDSNPVDLAFDSLGRLYIVDAGANTIWRWTAEEGAQVFITWPENPVPTSIEITPDDEIFVGFLTPYPFEAETSRIEQYSLDGTLINAIGGLTAVVELMWHDGTLYATEFARFELPTGWMPNTGRVVGYSSEGLRIIAEGLNTPYGLAVSPEGQLVVAVNSAYGEAGDGAVIAIGE